MQNNEETCFTCQKCGAVNEQGEIIRIIPKNPSYYQGRRQDFMLKLICAHCGAYRKFVDPTNEKYLLLSQKND